MNLRFCLPLCSLTHWWPQASYSYTPPWREGLWNSALCPPFNLFHSFNDAIENRTTRGCHPFRLLFINSKWKKKAAFIIPVPTLSHLKFVMLLESLFCFVFVSQRNCSMISFLDTESFQPFELGFYIFKLSQRNQISSFVSFLFRGDEGR